MDRRKFQGPEVVSSVWKDGHGSAPTFNSPDSLGTASRTLESLSGPQGDCTQDASASPSQDPLPQMLRRHRDYFEPPSQRTAWSSSGERTSPLPQRRHIFHKPALHGSTSCKTATGFRCREGDGDGRTQHRGDTSTQQFDATNAWCLSSMHKALPHSPITSPRARQWPYSLSDQVAGLVDAHCHLESVLSKAGHRGTYAQFRLKHQDTFPDCYEGCVTSFCIPATFKQRPVWERLLDEGGVWGAFGCHPHMTREYSRQVEENLLHALNHPSVVALGEVGLDYSKSGCDHELQQKVFRTQIGLALSRKLPLIIHSRDSTPDTISIMREMLPSGYPIHRHCFTGGWGEAQEWLRAFPNLCLGLTPLVTFRSVTDQPIMEVARNIPLDRLLLETDSPHFLPSQEARRLKQSHPGMVIHVAAHLSLLRNVPVEEILFAIRENARRIYGI